MTFNLSADFSHLWHPCTQMKDHENLPPIRIQSAKGPYLYTYDGQKIIDAISSWWCKSLGHQHPRLKAALIKQVENYEHVLLANTTNDVIAELSYKLSNLMKTLTKVFYASEGSSAVEIALKMSLHARYNQGDTQRKQFISLKNAYHGETTAALSVSDLSLYNDPYKPLLFDVHVLQDVPYVQNVNDPLWYDCASVWPSVEKQLALYADKVTAIIVEPIVQGSAGMLLYSQDFLRRLRLWTKCHNIHLIADEIMTGFGRTGLSLACMHANIEPDFLCLGKSLTAGWLPMSAVLTSNDIYDYFYDDYEQGKSFLHSHTFSGNALAASVALEALSIYEEENIYEKSREMQLTLQSMFQEIASKTGRLKNIRGIGAIIAADLIGPVNQRLGYKVLQQGLKKGALLRPLGNTLYWFPPLNIAMETLMALQDITTDAIMKAY